MSRIAIAFIAIMLFLHAPLAALAQGEPDSEIVYRANLGRADDVNLLLTQGASANDRDKKNIPLLALAAARIDPEGINVVKALVAAGADLKARDPKGQTPLFYAARKGNMETVKFLLMAGSDPYAIDNNGDMARTIAFRAGHQDIVDAIDAFIRQQAEDLKQQYEHMKLLQEKNALQKQLSDEEQKNAPPKKAAAPLPAPVPIPVPVPIPAPVPAPETPKPAPVPSLKTPEELTGDLKQMATDMAFNTCAFEYWEFVKTVQQSTELSPKELRLAIAAGKDKATALQETLVKSRNVAEPLAERIMDSARQRIYNPLKEMESNIERHERGVGHRDDMQSRCEAIAEEWDAPVPPPPGEPSQKSNGASKGGKSGSAAGTSPRPSSAKPRHP